MRNNEFASACRALLLSANGDDDDWIWLTLRFDAAVLILKSTQADKKDTVISLSKSAWIENLI